MFTGIIKEIGTIDKVKNIADGKKITISCNLAQEVTVDESITINGVCHTAIASDDRSFTVQSVAETLRKTNIGELAAGNGVNLERSLHPEQLLDGHLVQGHVDTAATITAIKKEGSDHIVTLSIPDEYKNLIVGRGSITLDGISLTVANISNHTFSVAIIPFTYEHTTMKYRKVGDKVNIEFDILGKYVVRYLENAGLQQN